MNLYEVTNGYTGESYVRVYVRAATAERAIELARAELPSGELRARNLCSDGDGELVTKASDSGWD